jgi:hypothetical protein
LLGKDGTTSMIRTDTLMAAILVCAAASCGGEEPGSSPTGDMGAWVEVVAVAGGQPTRLPAATGGIVVEGASFWLRELRLVADHGREDDRLRIRERALDLREGTAVFRLPEAPPGLYSRVRVRFERSGGGDDDDDDDRGVDALRVTGRGPDGVAFSVSVRDSIELDLRAGDGVDLVPGMGLTARVQVDLDEWWKGIQVPISDRGDRGEETSERLRENIARGASLVLRSGASRALPVAQ